ncbi:hypothetical protein DRW07_15095 [Alteromonas sediminis]|uniref:CPXCG motif-containing cysteine-rich protein n=1 Tax=Alteromonas sediminis TaxID=2259342 RepID=A0A3N5XXP5_9ALTE|nr:hypothetical protein [Alteromonas sediminis]RPJ65233.1 hypothetical protein DRW07_15095 [Alteromonas sediminis]
MSSALTDYMEKYMLAGVKQEFLCPHCGGLNTYITGENCALKEELVCCVHCRETINVIPAAGVDNSVNLIVSDCDANAATR